MENVHVILGPTASGKSAAAVEMAGEISGELVNLDSRQIYRNLDIGTNKGKVEYSGDEKLSNALFPVYLLDEVPLHLISFLDPATSYSAFTFRNLVYDCCANIIARRKRPILVGGSGLYAQVALYPQKYPGDEQLLDPDLRKRLTALSLSELQEQLKLISPDLWQQMNASDRQNPRRLVRALERTTRSDLPNYTELQAPYEFTIHYIDLPDVDLRHQIECRVEEMFDLGIIDEVKNLLQMGYSPSTPTLQGMGYREVLAHLNGEYDIAECKSRVKNSHWQYAKRQRTWFKKYLPPEVVNSVGINY